MKKINKTGYIKLFLGFMLIISVLISPGYNSLTVSGKSYDTSPPTAPKGLVAKSVGQNSALLKWSASYDKKGISAYLIYKNSTYIASTKGTSINITGLASSTSYRFNIRAKDYSGNVSALSKTLTVKTLPEKKSSVAKTTAPSTTVPKTTAPATVPSTTSRVTTAPSTTVPATSAPTTTKPWTTTPTTTVPTTAKPVTTTAPYIPVVLHSNKIIAGYYASWAAYSGYTPLNIPASKLTHINYAFAKIGDDLKIAVGDPAVDISNFSKLNQLKQSYPHIKTIISIGGWTWSGKFSDAALTEASRTAFADSIVEFIKKYNFDGVDLDWEYPVGGGLSTNSARPEDKTNFTLMLRKIREKLNEQSANDGKKYLLTFAGGAGNSFANNTELGILDNYVDFATIMTYDIHGSWDKYTDFNAPLYSPTEYSPQSKTSVDSAVKLWIGKGFSASKIVLGVPFYGHMYSGVAGGGNGLYKTYTSASSVSYDKVVSSYLSNSSFTKYYHSDARVPWLFNGSTFISYDDTDSLSLKAQYVNSNNLAGACAWELSQNKSGVLVNTLYNILN